MALTGLKGVNPGLENMLYAIILGHLLDRLVGIYPSSDICDYLWFGIYLPSDLCSMFSSSIPSLLILNFYAS